jgi:hypothetical protein
MGKEQGVHVPSKHLPKEEAHDPFRFQNSPKMVLFLKGKGKREGGIYSESTIRGVSKLGSSCPSGLQLQRVVGACPDQSMDPCPIPGSHYRVPSPLPRTVPASAFCSCTSLPLNFDLTFRTWSRLFLF